MINEFTIGITTFSKRLNFATNLIKQIRQHVTNNIVLVINGEKDGNFNEEYRQNILNVCLQHINVFPVFYIETRGLSKMWNTAVVTSSTDNILILNDDIEIQTRDIFDSVTNIIRSADYTGIMRMNGSFSHFVVNKSIIHKLGYFDERLLGFGEEDGDIVYRMLQINSDVGNVNVNGVVNIVSNVRHDFIKPGIGKYSNFNRQFIYEEKYKPNNNSPYKGMFDTPMDLLIENTNLYPYEKFFKDNKNNL